MPGALAVIGLLACIPLFLFLSAIPAQGTLLSADPVQVEVDLSPNSIRVGDRVALRVKVTHPQPVRVEFPVLQDKLGPIEVLETKPLSLTRFLDGSQVSAAEYTVTAFMPGRYSVPPLAITYVDAEGRKGTAESPQGVTLEVNSVLSTLSDPALRDIKPPADIPRAPVSYVRPAALGALGISVLVFLAMGYRRWRRAFRRQALPIALRDPETVAQEELARIAQLGLVEKGEFPAYYSLVSSCTRRYLDARLGLEALGSSTLELRQAMEVRGLDRWQARVVTGLLEECDAAKWAHYRPASARAQRALTIAFEIIDLVSNASNRLSQNGHAMGKAEDS